MVTPKLPRLAPGNEGRRLPLPTRPRQLLLLLVALLSLYYLFPGGISLGQLRPVRYTRFYRHEQGLTTFTDLHNL